jgi:hypothetical protein
MELKTHLPISLNPLLEEETIKGVFYEYKENYVTVADLCDFVWVVVFDGM